MTENEKINITMNALRKAAEYDELTRKEVLILDDTTKDMSKPLSYEEHEELEKIDNERRVKALTKRKK